MSNSIPLLIYGYLRLLHWSPTCLLINSFDIDIIIIVSVIPSTFKKQLLESINMLEKLSRKKKALLAAFFLFLTFAGLFVVLGYGVPIDEKSEMWTLLSNAKEYVVQIYGDDDPIIGKFTALGVNDLSSRTWNIDHGVAIHYIMAPFVLGNMSGLQPTRDLSVMWHSYTFLLFMTGIVFLYLLAAYLTGSRKSGILACLFMYLSPIQFAGAHYNSKDIVFMSLVLAVLWFGIRFIDSGQYLFAVPFAVISAFAANMRFIGFYAFGLVGMFYILSVITKGKWSKKTFFPGLTAIIVFFAVFIIITPATWPSIIEYFTYCLSNAINYNSWSGYVFFMGNLYNRVPFYYLPVMIAVTTPPLILAAIIYGHICSIRMIIKENKSSLSNKAISLILLLVFIWLPLGYAIICRPTLYNGWRHFFFIYGPLLLLVVCGINFLLKNAQKWKKGLIYSLIGLQLATSCLLIIVMYPNQFAYYNILAGTNPSSYFEMDYWNISSTECLEKLVDKENPSGTIKVIGSDFYSAMALKDGYYNLPTEYSEKIQIIPYGKPFETADYILANPMYVPIAQLEVVSDLEPRFHMEDGYEEIVSVREFGDILMAVYSSKSN